MKESDKEVKTIKRILIADDHAVVRQGLKQILQEEYLSLAEFGEATDGKEVLIKVRNEFWDIIILDISMPVKNGLEILKQFRVEFIKIPTLILSLYAESEYAMRMLKAGASGYLTKESASDELVTAVKQILNGRKYISESLTQQLLSGLDKDSDKPLHYSISNREFQVLFLIASGKTVSEIAIELSLSIPTISTYRARILEKMNMKNNAELINYAIRHGLV